MTNKDILKITVPLLLFFGVIMLISTPNNAEPDHYEGEPTVFIHGYKGTANSFGSMLERFEKEYKWGNKGYIYFVAKDGQVIDFNLNKNNHNPIFVQVVLENNRASFADSTKWISNVLQHMKDNYQANTVNLVGHSMGGIIALKYTKDFAGQEGYPHVSKLITIGSPFDGIYSEAYFQIHKDPAAEDLKPDSLALQLLREGNFPSYTQVLNIGSTGDAVALPKSVQALRTIIPREQFREMIIQNEKLGHSAMHENEQVDKMIHSFLWQDNGQ